MKNQRHHISPVKTPVTDDQSWDALYDRIRVLTLKRSAAMLLDTIDEDDAFDRGARSLRMLMSAAEISRRMKLHDAKEKSLDDRQETKPIISDKQANEALRSARHAIERAEKNMDAAPGDQGCPDALPSGVGAKAVEDQRP